MIEHQSVVRLIKNNNWFSFSGHEVVLCTGSISFDVTVFEIFGPLLSGGQLVLCSRDTVMQAQRLKRLMITYDVNTMWFTAGLLHQFVDSDINLFAPLKVLMGGGDKLSARHIRKLRKTYP